MTQVRCLAPAKINLFLRIVGRRADGFHLLDSLMVAVELADEVAVDAAFGQTTSIAVLSDHPAAPGGPANLAYRAATRFLEATGRSARLTFRINKHIPVGSGLGGGSSDAAAVLWALNTVADSPLNVEQLMAVGARLGSDVPFFVHRTGARVRGVGDVVAPVAFPRQLAVVLCSTGTFVSTRTVYSRVDLSLTSGPGPTSIHDFVAGQKPISELLVNDLEAAVAQIHPEVLSVKSTMSELGALGTLMSGSGSAVFGIWPDASSAMKAAHRLRARGLWAHATRTLDGWSETLP